MRPRTAIWRPEDGPEGMMFLTALAEAAAAKPTVESGVAWENALVAVLEDLAGAGWVRCVSREGATHPIARMAAEWPETFPLPIYYRRVGAKSLNWHDVFLIGRPKSKPSTYPLMPAIWWGPELGLSWEGTTGLTLANVTLANCYECYVRRFTVANSPQAGQRGHRDAVGRLEAALAGVA